MHCAQTLGVLKIRSQFISSRIEQFMLIAVRTRGTC